MYANRKELGVLLVAANSVAKPAIFLFAFICVIRVIRGQNILLAIFGIK